MRSKRTFCLLVFLLCLGLAGRLGAEEMEKMETDLSGLPEAVRTAAEKAKKDIVLTGYRKEYEIRQWLYEVEGTVGTECYEIKVTEKGKVLEMEPCD